jgi:acyl-CoA synthetase (AMP-forming)/AMP-acid ligase II
MNSLQHLLCANFKQHATRPAVQGAHITLSYEELARASSELAITLHAQGLRAGDVAPLLMARSALLVVVEVALARLGVTYAPIDLGSPEPRQHVMLQAIKAKLVIVNDDQHHRTPLAGAVEVDAQTTHSFNVADWWRDWSQRKLRHLGAADDATAEATAPLPPTSRPICGSAPQAMKAVMKVMPMAAAWPTSCSPRAPPVCPRAFKLHLTASHGWCKPCPALMCGLIVISAGRFCHHPHLTPARWKFGAHC